MKIGAVTNLLKWLANEGAIVGKLRTDDEITTTRSNGYGNLPLEEHSCGFESGILQEDIDHGRGLAQHKFYAIKESKVDVVQG